MYAMAKVGSYKNTKVSLGMMNIKFNKTLYFIYDQVPTKSQSVRI